MRFFIYFLKVFLLNYFIYNLYQKKISSIPKNARPGIVIINLDEWVTVPILKRYIEEIPLFS